jgi:riboflavin synthase
LRFDVPAALARYIARKGSIAIDGVSLTVNEVDGTHFGVNLIPHTLSVTTLGEYGAGTLVNIEVDIIARYLERLVSQTTGLETMR